MNQNSNVYKRIKSNQLDNLELLKATNYNESFPLHSHDTFCVSLIENGTFKENETYAATGTIFISNPNEIHRNDLVFETGYSFKTLYISPDAMANFNARQPVLFEDKGIENPKLFQTLNQISESMLLHPLSISTEKTLSETLKTLVQQYAHQPKTEVKNQYLDQFALVKAFICENLNQKISLEDLSRIMDLDKFKFLRFFKKQLGMTPFNYITMLRIEQGKTFLQQGKTLIDAALDAGFYDQSHFTHYFNHYVGVTPNNFKLGCNILQDKAFF